MVFKKYLHYSSQENYHSNIKANKFFLYVLSRIFLETFLMYMAGEKKYVGVNCLLLFKPNGLMGLSFGIIMPGI